MTQILFVAIFDIRASVGASPLKAFQRRLYHLDIALDGSKIFQAGHYL